MLPQDCQIQGIPRMADGEAEVEPLSLLTQARLLLKRYVPHKTKRQLKKVINNWVSRLSKDGHQRAATPAQTTAPAIPVSRASKDGRQGGLIPVQTIDLEISAQVTVSAKPAALKAGDRVRVRSYEEIAATIDRWGELRGCGFLNEMREYCGTTQRVFKPVERVVDERDYRVRKCSGIVLLEGLICCGAASYGHCDRSCFYFWREEWLEKIE